MQAVLFKLRHLNVKKLEERNVSPLTILYFQRYAIIPFGLLTLLTFRIEYLNAILSNPPMIFALAFMTVFWIVQEYIGFFATDSVNALSFLNAFYSIMKLPVYLIIGILVNNDHPNLFTFIALLCLGVALFIRPAPHPKGKAKSFQHSWLLITILVLMGVIVDGANSGLYRFVLQSVEGVLFVIGLTSVLGMLGVNVFFLFKKQPVQEIRIAKKEKWLTFSIVALWCLATIPEGYAVLSAPIYTVIAISSFTFITDVVSDLHNNRVRMNLRTICFVLFAFVGVVLSALSL